MKKLLNMEFVRTILSDNICNNILKTALIIILMFLAIKLGNKIIDLALRKELKLSKESYKKVETFKHVLKSILKYSTYFIGIISILSIYLGPIPLTFAGIGGVAIGLGAQSLIKDFLNGLFMLSEGQYAVGDCVTILNKKGIVEKVDLRITKIRGINGDLYIFPNGSITSVTNHSKGPQQFSVNVNIDYEENIDKVIDILGKVCKNFGKTHENIIESPKVQGISEFGERGVSVKIFGKAKPLTQTIVENHLRETIKRELDKAKIEFAYTKIKK